MRTDRPPTHLVAVHVPVRQHVGRIVFVHELAGQGTNEFGLRAVGKGQLLGKGVEQGLADRTVCRPLDGLVVLARVLLGVIALTVEMQLCRSTI